MYSNSTILPIDIIVEKQRELDLLQVENELKRALTKQDNTSSSRSPSPERVARDSSERRLSVPTISVKLTTKPPKVTKDSLTQNKLTTIASKRNLGVQTIFPQRSMSSNNLSASPACPKTPISSPYTGNMTPSPPKGTSPPRISKETSPTSLIKYSNSTVFLPSIDIKN